ncbi:hypothetical protein MJM04_29920, partial [Salmonella enterica subsp. enterica serovar Cerro]|nr:hypothetical protein [Salmonella enterica subsp. enterica serovar Cerro]
FPDPWRTNPVGRFWDRLRGRDVTPRYVSRLTKEEQASEQKWRYQVTDVQILHDKGKLIPADWQSRLPNNSSPFYSTMGFLVRKG